MVTVRTYWNPAKAALEKSLLENYEVSCALLHENSNLYAEGAQFAVPIRLVVDENEVSRALCILNDDFDRAAEFENGEEASETLTGHVLAHETVNRNPWELLLLAFYLFLPAICLIFTRFPQVGGRWGGYMAARVIVTQFLSWVAAIFAFLLILLYFAVRRSGRKTHAAN